MQGHQGHQKLGSGHKERTRKRETENEAIQRKEEEGGI